MIHSKKGLWLAFLIPILSLAILIGYKKHVLSVGSEVTLAIVGHDPRDLLSGHYLTYTIDYGVGTLCRGSSFRQSKSAYVCLNPKSFTYQWPENCSLLIEGTCSGGVFLAGIERYFVPEEEAKKLEGLARSNKASIVLSVSASGEAQIKDLLINGNSWRSQ